MARPRHSWLIAGAVVLVGLVVLWFAYAGTDWRLVGTWREAPPYAAFGRIPGRDRVFQFLPNRTVVDTEYYANWRPVASCTWSWRSRGDVLTMRVDESSPSTSSITNGLTMAFDAVDRWFATVPYHDESKFRIIEATASQLRLQQGEGEKSREVIFERVP